MFSNWTCSQSGSTTSGAKGTHSDHQCWTNPILSPERKMELPPKMTITVMYPEWPHEAHWATKEYAMPSRTQIGGIFSLIHSNQCMFCRACTLCKTHLHYANHEECVLKPEECGVLCSQGQADQAQFHGNTARCRSSTEEGDATEAKGQAGFLLQPFHIFLSFLTL